MVLGPHGARFPLPACGERAASEASRVRRPIGMLGLADKPSHPARKRALPSPRARGEVTECAARATGTHLSSTHVSLVPPPWLELTTREPLLSATRVRPPGTMRTRLRPVSTNGRRSTWRGATPSSTQVGQVESASVGWAMKFFGLDLSLARKDAIVALSDFGPINMP